MRRKRRSSSWLARLVILVVVVAAVAAWWQFRGLGSTETVKLVVLKGESIRAVGDSLRSRGVILSSPLFAALSRLVHSDEVLKPGRYTMPARTSEFLAVRHMFNSRDRDAFVTIPEGFTNAQIAGRLAREQVCDSAAFLTACSDRALLDSLRIPGPSAEGYLFPDSYFLTLGSEPAEVIALMHRRFIEVVNSLTPAPGSLTPEMVTLASLVEAEAEQDSERPIIASVFLNRLKRGMRLQSCATVEYVLPERKAVLSDADTRFDSPYNTYLHPGLPPGPICNPGKPSLAAAMNPARTNYLFFVMRGGGCHYFSTNFAEHLAAQKRYRQPQAPAVSLNPVMKSELKGRD
jgi:UPF0755 protein